MHLCRLRQFDVDSLAHATIFFGCDLNPVSGCVVKTTDIGHRTSFRIKLSANHMSESDDESEFLPTC